MEKNQKEKLIVILGPTASGKSSLAISLAKEFNGEIVSADSRQIYKEMNIGTNKTTTKEMQKIKHYMINIARPDQDFSLAQYKISALKAIRKIKRKEKIPFLVGGTGLYIQSIVENLQIPETAPNKRLRDELEGLNNELLQEKLKELDPETYKKIDLNNRRRLIRALEVCITTQKPFSEQKIKGEKIFDTFQIGIDVPREDLYAKIDKRVDEMIALGLVDEVKKLAKRYSWEFPALSGIGYRQIKKYLDNTITLPEAIDQIKKETRNYAKRQMTWFKRDKTIHWIQETKQAEKLIKKFLA